MEAGSVFTFDLGPEAPPGEALAALLDGEADRAGGGNRNCGHVLFVRALASAVASGTGEVPAPPDDASAYRARDMIDRVLRDLQDGSAGALALRQLLGQFGAFTGWDEARARQRDAHDGLSERTRTAVQPAARVLATIQAGQLAAEAQG